MRAPCGLPSPPTGIFSVCSEPVRKTTRNVPHRRGLPVRFQKSEEPSQRCIRERKRKTVGAQKSLDVQILDTHQTLRFRHRCGQLVEHIVTNARNFVGAACNLLARLVSALPPRLFSTEGTMGMSHLLEGVSQGFLVLQHRRIAESCQPIDAHINADRWVGSDRTHIWHFDLDRHNPPRSHLRYACAGDFALKTTTSCE